MANFVFTYSAPGGSVGITTDAPSTIVAPAQIWLTASDPTGLAATELTGDTYDPPFHEYYYEWTVNGQPLADWDKPVNLIAEHNNPNKAFGKEVAFCLTDPGDYVIDLVVTDKNGNTATASTSTITVQDPETYFPANRRVYVASDGDFTGVPVGAATVQTLEELRTHMLAKNSTHDAWIRFKRGNTWDFSDYFPTTTTQNIRCSVWMTWPTPCLMMSDWGDAGDANPLFYGPTVPGSSSKCLFEVRENTGSTFFTACNLDFEGGYNSDTERGDYGTNQGGAFGTNMFGDGRAHFHNIRVQGLGKGFYIDNPSNTHRIMVSSCHITSYYDYGIFGGAVNQKVAYVGNYINRGPNSLWGQQSAFTNYHAAIRIPCSPGAYISGNDLFSKGGWGSPVGYDQPCLRLCVSTGVNDQAVVERNCMEGGFEVLQIMKKDYTSGGSDYCVPMNAVVERNLLISAATTATAIAVQRGGVTIRDNLFVHPNAPKHTPVNGSIRKTISGSESTAYSGDIPSTSTDPIVIYGNTTIDLASSSNDSTFGTTFWSDASSYFQNVVGLEGGLGNNVYHGPNLDTPIVGSAPVDTTTLISGVTLRYPGPRPNFRVFDYTISAVANGGNFTIPYSSILQDMQDGSSLGGATNQAYWTAIEGTDTLHQIMVGPPSSASGEQSYRYYAAEGHFTVTFGATEVTITNTSGKEWGAGSAEIHLDRTSLIPATDSTYASPTDVPLPRPQTGSAAIGGATTGRVSPKDFLLADRGATPSKGALEPV